MPNRYAYATFEERFWAKVDDSGGPDACWPWMAYRMPDGHGMIGRGGRGRHMALAHRVAWELVNGPIPRGMNVCHRCDNPPCVNARHLFLGSQRDNLQDMWRKGRGFIPAGERHPRARLSPEDVAAIRAADVGRYGATAELARRYGVASTHISAIRKGKRWQSV